MSEKKTSTDAALAHLAETYPSLPDVLWQVQVYRMPNLQLRGTHIFVLPHGFIFYHGPVFESIESRMTYVPQMKVERMHQIAD